MAASCCCCCCGGGRGVGPRATIAPLLVRFLLLLLLLLVCSSATAAQHRRGNGGGAAAHEATAAKRWSVNGGVAAEHEAHEAAAKRWSGNGGVATEHEATTAAKRWHGDGGAEGNEAAAAAKHRHGNDSGTAAHAAAAELRSGEELAAFRRIKGRLDRTRAAAVKTIRSPDGDVIDCVPWHLQPAFELPELRGKKPEDAPAATPRRGHGDDGGEGLSLPQAWSDSGEWCPEGTIPMRRTTEDDLLRASSLRRFGMKQPRARRGGAAAAAARRDSASSGHEHAVGYVAGRQFYGAKASLNVWPAKVSSPAEFSLSQIWIISGSFGNDLNTIEAGWQVSPELYGDSSPRFFTYWTNDAYQETGCYNLHCSGFVQTSSRVAIGAAISPVSAYGGGQFDITVLIWKDPKQGHWWLQLGAALVGYWPSSLFTHLGAARSAAADMVQFGGEAVNTRPAGAHTPTQMGSGRFPGEGYGRAAYFRNVQVVDWDNNLIPAAGLRLLADHPGCYDIAGGQGGAWGSYFYYGGPGRNARCP